MTPVRRCDEVGNGVCSPESVSTNRDVRLTLEVKLRDQPYVLTVTAQAFKLARKGRRAQIELPWTAFLDEDAAMLSALHASMRKTRQSGK
jgi:hypothetical protein